MQKAKLTGRQAVSAIFAGIIGHFFFVAGWAVLAAVLLGSVVIAILGGTIGGIGELAGGVEVVRDVLGSVGGFIGGFGIAIAAGAVVLILLGVLFSGLILRGGKVRKPWGTTWTSILIAALLSVPLLILYTIIAGNAADGQPRFTIVGLIGTAVVGILIWLWMTWAHRGSASEFAGVSASASSSGAIPPGSASSGAAVPPAKDAPPEA